MDGLVIVLIVVGGISIGVIGILLVVAFIWLHKKHDPGIPGSLHSGSLAFSITSSNRPFSERSWDSVVVYNSEGGERDNRTFDRNALQVATVQTFSPGAPNRIGATPDSNDHATISSNVNQMHAPSSGHVEPDDDVHIYSEVSPTVHRILSDPRDHAQLWRHDQANGSDDRSTSPAELNDGDGVRFVDVDYRASATELDGADTVRAADRNYRGYASERGDRNAVQATSFQYANPVALTPVGDDTLPAKDSFQQYDAEGDMSMGSLSSIETEKSDASIVLTPLRLTRPATGPLGVRGPGGEMFI